MILGVRRVGVETGDVLAKAMLAQRRRVTTGVQSSSQQLGLLICRKHEIEILTKSSPFHRDKPEAG